MVWGKARSDRLDGAGDRFGAGALFDVHAGLKPPEAYGIERKTARRIRAANPRIH
jgi:hypothetical protein